LIGLAVALAIPLTVYAAHFTINTNDGIVDPSWASVTPLSSDSDDFFDDNYDIDQAWVTNAADNSFFYFRANLMGTGQLSPPPSSSITAEFDCDQDGNPYGASDVIVSYNPFSDISIECQGYFWPFCTSGPGPGWDWNDITTGEEILGTPNNYEWQADVNNGNVNWSACLGTVNIRFVTYFDPLFPEMDATAWQAYNAPTVVVLEKFSAGQPKDTFIVPIALLSLLAVLTVTTKVLAGRLWHY